MVIILLPLVRDFEDHLGRCQAMSMKALNDTHFFLHPIMSFSCALIRPALRQTSRIARTTCIGRAGFASSSRVAEESTLSKKQSESPRFQIRTEPLSGASERAKETYIAEELLFELYSLSAISSCAPGTVLHGLNVLKDSSDPVAKPDEEYPAWLWNLIPTGKNSDLAEQPKQVVKKGETFDYAAEKRRLKAM